MMQRNRKRPALAALFGWMCLFAATASHAAEPLRWKFAVGDELVFETDQVMRLKLEGLSDGIASKVRQRIEMTWHVDGVDENGSAVIVGRFTRIRTNMEDAEKEKLNYDSASDDVPAGLAAMISPMYEAMTAGEYEITMSARGEVRDVRIPDEVAARVKKGPGIDAVGVDAGIAAFKSMITQGVVPLPEDEPTAGQTWSTTADVHIPNCERATVETVYQYEGEKEVDGRTYAVIRPTLTMDLVGNDKLQTKVREQSTQGEILFDAASGRVRSIDLEHQAAVDVTVGGQALAGSIDQQIKVNVTPKSE